jgi:cyanophycinase-like exopeptidase
VGEENSATYPGTVILFGSGETSAAAGKVYELAAAETGAGLKIAVLETPAGFELNSSAVAGAVGNYLEKRLQNYNPQVEIIPARKRGTAHSPDDLEIIRPMLAVDWIFAGPGSPTYAVRQLRDTLAFESLVAKHRMGDTLIFASAAVLAISAYTLPVYEIYKVGEDLHWIAGLDLFTPYGLKVAFISHWNNQDGGKDLDTSRCFMGQSRFAELLSQLPADVLVVGIDEGTALVMRFDQQVCEVTGRGVVTILEAGKEQAFEAGQSFAFSRLGNYTLPEVFEMMPGELRETLQENQKQSNRLSSEPSTLVLELVEQREQARKSRDWGEADALRTRILAEGWLVNDTANGPQVIPVTQPRQVNT